jgi:pSer/pThr/pTyr-binding forkhead associated (FHA) protein
MGETKVFGRDPSCDVVLDDPYVSPRHCRIWQDDDGCLWTEDLGSTNGTWLDRLYLGTRVYGPTPLAGHDVMWIGRTRIPITAAADG